MNVNRDPERAIDPGVWERPEIRRALAVRDVGSVFRLLQRHGISQRRIAGLTGQSQSEVSEILGGRQVMAYEVLVRVADGLGIPRSYMGLAYDETTADIVSTVTTTVPRDEREEVRQLLAHVAEVTIGAATLDPSHWSTPLDRTLAAPPSTSG